MSSLAVDVEFVDRIDVKYKCNHCKRRLRDPQQLKCGHRYCKSCIDQLLQERAKGRCPVCCEEDKQSGAPARNSEDVADGILVPENVFPDNAIRREIGRLKCYCGNAPSCSWTGLYQSLEEHLTNKCEYTIVNCRLNCGQQVARNALPGHESADCKERLVTCDHCGEKSKAKDMENHLQVCAHVLVMCSGCQQTMPRANLAAHQDRTSGSCTRQYVPCPYGCTDQLNKDNLEKHKERCLVTHLDVVKGKVRDLEKLTQLQKPPQEQQQQQLDAGIVEVNRPSEGGGSEEKRSVTNGIGGSGAGGRGNGFGANGTSGRHIGGEVISIAVAASAPSRSSTGQPPSSSGSMFAQPPTKQQRSERTQEDSGIGDSAISEGQRPGTSGDVPQGGASRPEIRSKLTMLTEDVVPNMSKAVEVLSYETKGCAAVVKTLKDYKLRQQEHTQLMEEKVKAIERRIQVKESRLVELATRLEMLEQVHHDGILLWRITDFQRKKREAISGKATQVTSHPFFTSPVGYKMCARAYLNGDASAKGTHLSIFFVLMKGPYDAVLRWPFIQKVTIMLLDQNTSKGHVKDSFQPDPMSQSFKRPTEMNVPVGCPQFCSLKDLEDPNRGYLKEDAIFIKMIIERTM